MSQTRKWSMRCLVTFPRYLSMAEIKVFSSLLLITRRAPFFLHSVIHLSCVTGKKFQKRAQKLQVTSIWKIGGHEDYNFLFSFYFVAAVFLLFVLGCFCQVNFFCALEHSSFRFHLSKLFNSVIFLSSFFIFFNIYLFCFSYFLLSYFISFFISFSFIHSYLLFNSFFLSCASSISLLHTGLSVSRSFNLLCSIRS